MIRTGVTALFEKGSGLDYTDHELDVLLGTCQHGYIGVTNILVIIFISPASGFDSGRDVAAADAGPSAPPVTGTTISEVSKPEEEEDEETTVKAFWQERGEIDLEEVDMHQLDGVTYTKGGEAVKQDGKRRRQAEVNLEDLIFTKRVRRERVVKVDGKGTGYGGSVPVLAEQLIEDEATPEAVSNG